MVNGGVMRNLTILFVAMVFVSACARTSVTPIAQNQVLIKTSAAPVCGSGGSQSVASDMAAIATLRNGYERYIILGAQGENNVSAFQTGPTGSTTTGTATVSGNNIYGSSTTTYTGGRTIIAGTHDTALHVVMLNPGDDGYENGLDAKEVLGEDWEKRVKSGISTC